MCPKCGFATNPESFFCPNCGKQLKSKLLSTSALSQIKVYLISFFVPPYGLFSAYKYLKQGDSKSKMIGVAAFVLTVASMLLTVWITSRLTATLNETLDSQLQLY